MKTHILGFPRFGAQRELKFALERFWCKESNEVELLNEASKLRNKHWQIQKKKGLSYVCTGDFSLYDHVLDTLQMLGMIPSRFQSFQPNSLEQYFAMARGEQSQKIHAMEMSKWFNTNYHFIVPEIEKDMKLQLGKCTVLDQTIEAKSNGFNPKAVLLGPVTLLSIAKGTNGCSPWEKVDEVLSIYKQVILSLSKLCEWIQIDEPILVGDMSADAQKYFPMIYQKINEWSNPAKIMLTTYFDSLDDNLDLAIESHCAGLHFDLVRGNPNFDKILDKIPQETVISLGIVDGRNIWKNDYSKSLQIIENTLQHRDDSKIFIGSSSSLLHVPFDLDFEKKLDPIIRETMAYAVQKCEEIQFLSQPSSVIKSSQEWETNLEIFKRKSQSEYTCIQEVRDRIKSIRPEMMERAHVFSERVKEQSHLNLPLFPTTTIGSFPQTQEIRKYRRGFKNNLISTEDYNQFIKDQIAKNIKVQDDLNLDVYVHGEPERNDMVEYFGEQLCGFCFSENGWVQSYGSRCVKPPIIYGDVKRTHPMTIDWIRYAQSLTHHPMKGMLTGPVTILCWSFVRNDIPREDVCKQIALAIRDEVMDLEKAQIKVIQIDEAAISEGMPIKQRDKANYLKWAVDAFKLTSCGVQDSTQIHTHMCYSEFNTIIEAIAQMDADVISIESSRSKMELLDVFQSFNYPNDIGPGIYDIHSPRIPTQEEMFHLLQQALKYIPKERLWVNPDCGLKTRRWEEVIPSLQNMVSAALSLRETYNKS